MANSYYTHTSYPVQGSSGLSSLLRAELDLVEDGFDKLPVLATHANQVQFVNTAETAVTGNSGFLFTLSTTTLTLDGTLAGSALTITTPVINTPTINTPTIATATFTGTSSGGTFSGGTYTTSTITAPTITNPTVTGGGTFASPAITTASFTGTSTGGTFSGGTYTTSTITAPTITNPTVTGGGTFASPAITTASFTGTSTGGTFSGGTYTTSTITAPTVTNPTITGGGTFATPVLTTATLAGVTTATGKLEIATGGTVSEVRLISTGGGVDENVMRLVQTNGVGILQIINDAEDTTVDIMNIARTGMTVDTVTFPSSVLTATGSALTTPTLTNPTVTTGTFATPVLTTATLNGTTTATGAVKVDTGTTNTRVHLTSTGGAADENAIQFQQNAGAGRIQIVNDADSSAITVMEIGRTGMTVDTVNFPNGILTTNGVAVSIHAVVSDTVTVPAVDSTFNFAHGLGYVPNHVSAVLVCKTAEHGYVADDEVEYWNWATGGEQMPTRTSADDTNVSVRTADALVIVSTTYTYVFADLTKWDIIVRHIS